MVEGGRLLILFGIVFVVAGLLLSLIGRGWRLPGDILIRRDGVTVYIPIVTSLALSVILTLVLSLFFRRR
ncbi:MAG TPA: DUF2905 domain-containing protein [bacterium]|nr:DUF2905 domain-containing protein [bacterium]